MKTFLKKKRKYKLKNVVWGKSRRGDSKDRKIYDRCINCGKIDYEHHAKGLCEKCYFKVPENIDKIRATKKKYKNSVKGKISNAKYRKSDKRRTIANRYASKARTGKLYTTEEINNLFKKYNYRCANCGSKTRLEVDHFYPLSKGGANNGENLQVLCRSCNAKKSNKIISIDEGFRDPEIRPMYRYAAKCIRVIDGDSIVCNLDCGFYIFLNKVIVRLNRINAPELKGNEKVEGLKSKKWLKDKIEGKEIVIETLKEKQRGKFGRYLAEIYINGVNLNDKLVEKKLAKYKEY